MGHSGHRSYHDLVILVAARQHDVTFKASKMPERTGRKRPVLLISGLCLYISHYVYTYRQSGWRAFAHFEHKSTCHGKG
jgi:hypothetical protein